MNIYTKRLIQYAKEGRFMQMTELLSAKSTQQTQTNQESINEGNSLSDQQKKNILQSILQHQFFQKIDGEISQEKLTQLRQNADYLLQLSPFFIFSEFKSQETSDLLFLESVLLKHKQLNQLKYALALFREQISMIKMGLQNQKTVFKFVSAAWIFVDLIAEGKKVMVDVLHIISQFYQLGNSIERKLMEQEMYQENKQNINENKQIYDSLVLLRLKVTRKCIETLEHKTIQKIDQSLTLYRKAHVIDLLSYLLTPTISQIQNSKNKSAKIDRNSLKSVLTRYNISFKQLTGNLLTFFLNQLEMLYSKDFIFTKIVDTLLICLPDSPNQFNQANPHFLSPRNLQQKMYKAPMIQLKSINKMIEKLCSNFLDDQKFISNKINRTYVQLIKKLALHLGAGITPKSSTHKILLNTINNLKGVNNVTKQVIWRSIIEQISQNAKQNNSQLTENQCNFKSFCISQYRKLLTPKQTIFQSDREHFIVLMNTSRIIKQQVVLVKDKHGNLNFLAHLLTMLFYWKKMIEKMMEKGISQISLSSFSQRMDFKDQLAFVSQICLKLKDELRIRQESSKNEQQKSDLLICIFRINQLNFQ